MTTEVSQHLGGHYEIRLMQPEELWTKLLAKKMLCDEVTVVSLALSRGLIDLMTLFAKPDGVDEE